VVTTTSSLAKSLGLELPISNRWFFMQAVTASCDLNDQAY